MIRFDLSSWTVLLPNPVAAASQKLTQRSSVHGLSVRLVSLDCKTLVLPAIVTVAAMRHRPAADTKPIDPAKPASARPPR